MRRMGWRPEQSPWHSLDAHAKSDHPASHSQTPSMQVPCPEQSKGHKAVEQSSPVQ